MQSRSPKTEYAPLILLDDPGAPWHVFGDPERGGPVAYVRGYATVEDQAFESESLAVRVEQLASRGADALRGEIPRLNGGWALVVVWPAGDVLAAVDRMRTVPLFFYHNDPTFAIAASGVDLARRFSRPIDRQSELNFLLFGYVSGAGTLYENVRQVQAGEIIEYRVQHHPKITANRYYRFYPSADRFSKDADLSSSLADVLRRQFERFRDGYRGEQVAIPLSGGLDSRLVAGMLKRMGVENCLCYTYGDESHEEVRISRRVAEALGYRWRCFQQTPEAFGTRDIYGEFREYWPYACKGVSCPCAHDFAAVLQLADEGVSGPDTIFFPGHSADMTAGSHIPPDYQDLYTGVLSVTDEIIRHHAQPAWYEPLHLLVEPYRARILAELSEQAAPPSDGRPKNPLACCEMWNATERQSKYIINSVRTYEWVGSRWRTLWDYEFMDFFLRVPNELRYGQNLHLECLRSKIFVGDLAALAAIPVAKHGPLASLTRLRGPVQSTSILSRYGNAVKKSLRWRLLRAGMPNPRIQAEDPVLKTIVRLSGMETSEGSALFGTALDRIGALASLHSGARDALAPWLSLRLDSVPGFAILTVLVLAEMSRE
jgi:asparagine synthase (glutamine-hydrolysing)